MPFVRPFLVTVLCLLPTAGMAWEISPKEQMALTKVDQGKFKDARRLANEALGSFPGIVARYVLAMVQSESEGNLPRALFLIRAARTQLKKVEQEDVLTQKGKQWHRKLLRHELGVLGHLDRRQEQLDLIDIYEQTHQPKITELRIWPMVKLGLYEEARELAISLLKHEEPLVRQRALNGLMAVEEEAGNRQASFDWGEQALRELGTRSCVITTNTALGARRIFDFSKAIAIDLDALKAEREDCPTSPHAQLAPVYLLSGDFQKSVSALKSLRAAPRTARMALQNEMLIRGRFVEILLALGAFEPAWIRIKKIIDHPDRSGMVSYSPDLVELGNLILGYAVGQAHLSELDERLSARPFNSRWSLRLDKLKLQLQLLSIKRQIRRLAGVKDHLTRVIRPYMYENMMWYTLPVIEALGGAVIESAVKDALKIERDLAVPAKSILDAYHVETAFKRAHYQKVIELGTETLGSMPKGPVLLKSRIRAQLADAHYRTGNTQAAFKFFTQVMNTFPTVMRMLDLRLPVSMSIEGEIDDSIRDRITNSPRLNFVEQSPFTLQLSQSGDETLLCLVGTKRYGCERIKTAKLQDGAAVHLDTFHHRVFAPGIEMTQADMSSLDGRAVQGDAASVIEDLIGRPREAQE